MFETYKPSGSFGPLTILLLLVGLALTVALAFVYQLALYWVPLIYISFLLTIGFGFCLGAIGSRVIRWGHCRNMTFAFLTGLLIVGTGIFAKHYFQYQTMTADGTLNQGGFFEHFQQRADIGISIGKAGRQGMPITGIFMYLIWLIEAGAVVYYSLSEPTSEARAPYSEKKSQWASEAEQVMLLPIDSEEMVFKIKAATTVEELLELPIPKTDEVNRFAVYTVYSIPGQELEDAYLSVDLMTMTVNSDGETEADLDPLVKFAILTSERRKQLIENSELLNEAMEAYREAMDEEALAASDVDVDSADEPG